MIPPLKREIEMAGSPMALWIELHFKLEDAYEEKLPDDELIKQIYAYAHWCLRKANNTDIFTAVVYAFYEHVLTHKKVRHDLPNQMNRKDFLALDGYLAYHLTDEEFDEYSEKFLSAKEKLLHKTGGRDIHQSH